MHFFWKSQKTITPDPIFNGIQRMDKVENQLFVYNEKEVRLEKEIDIIALKIDDKSHIKWLNFHGIHEEETIDLVANKLHLNTLVIQDILNTNQRSKFKDYESYIYLSIKSILPDEGSELIIEQISFILKEKELYTFQEMKSDHFEHIRSRITNNQGKVRIKKADFLLYLMLEAILDNYFETIHNFWPQIDELSSMDDISDSSEKVAVRIEKLRELFLTMKRSILPFKETITKLNTLESSCLDPNNYKYFSELKDQSFHLLDEIDFILHRLESALNLNFSFQSNRMNEVMKTLTMVSTIFIPLTFIAGIYGMNFEFMPELKNPNGYGAVLILMGLISVGIMIFFKRKKWF